LDLEFLRIVTARTEFDLGVMPCKIGCRRLDAWDGIDRCLRFSIWQTGGLGFNGERS
jgi:hypothetical protein